MRVSVALRIKAVMLAAVLGLAHPAVAGALEPGVHVDPGSPAAKEYALPLSQARQTGTGHSTAGGSSTALFGAGIGVRGSGNARRGGSRVSNRSPHSNDGGRGDARHRPQTSVASAVRTPSSQGGGGSLPAVLGGAVLVLVLGTVGGVVLRGRRSSHST